MLTNFHFLLDFSSDVFKGRRKCGLKFAIQKSYVYREKKSCQNDLAERSPFKSPLPKRLRIETPKRLQASPSPFKTQTSPAYSLSKKLIGFRPNIFQANTVSKGKLSYSTPKHDGTQNYNFLMEEEYLSDIETDD